LHRIRWILAVSKYIISLLYDLINHSNACGNCKRKDHASYCTLAIQDEPLPPSKEEKTITTRSGRTTKAPAKYAL
jgi:hypothetical protein